MQQQLISIIVPVYNVRDYLQQCIDSILAQTHRNIELILVNDGSTDGSDTICDDYAKLDTRVRVIHKTNGGLSSARNAGMQVMKGEYVMFVDSDDWIETTTCSECLANFQKHQDVEMVRFRMRQVDDKGIIKTNIENNQGLKLSCKEYLQKIARGAYLGMFAWGCMIKTSLIHPSIHPPIHPPIRFREGLYHEDEFFTLELLGKHMQAKIYLSSYIGYNYRIGREGSITKQYTDRNVRDLLQGFLLTMESLNGIPEALALVHYYCLYILSVQYGQVRRGELQLEDNYLNLIQPFIEQTQSLPLASVNKLPHIRWFRISPFLYYQILRVRGVLSRLKFLIK